MSTGSRQHCAQMPAKRGYGEGSIHKRADGRWSGVIDLGWKDGKRRRKYVYGVTRAQVVDKVKDVQKAREAGPIPTKGQTVAQWYATYLEKVATPKVRPSTLANYRREYDKHIGPNLGRLRLEKLEPVHLADLYARKQREGLSVASVRLLHANIRRCLNVAMKWGLITRNVALVVDPPSRVDHEVDPFTVDEARRFLAAIRGHRMEARWIVGLSLGLRQGEALGLWWDDFDLEAGTVQVRRQLERPRVKGAKPTFGPLKTARSRRKLNLPSPVLAAIRAHDERQYDEQQDLGEDACADARLVFATTIGTPIDARNDNREFKAILKAAGLRDIRLHDLRHTAASLLVAQKVPMRVVMEVLGHSQIGLSMNTYSQVAEPVLQAVADAVTSALWDEPGTEA